MSTTTRAALLSSSAERRSSGAGGVSSTLPQRRSVGSGGARGACGTCPQTKIRTATGAAVAGPVHEVLRSPGTPLGSGVRGFMQARFGHDFGRVRIHTDDTAAASARAIGALAYTVDQHVVFATGQYAPESRRGRAILAHELAHVVQQSRTDPRAPLAQAGNTARYEREAGATARLVCAGNDVRVRERAANRCVMKVDLSAQFLNDADIDPKVAVVSPDFIDNNIDDAGLREEWSGLSVRFVAVTLTYKDGSLLDIPINATYLRSPAAAGEMQVVRYRKHTPTGKIVPLIWRGTPADLPETPGGPLGTVFFAKDVTPHVMAYYDNALVKRAFVFSGEIAGIWSAALAATGMAQIFSATQAAAVAAAGRSALGSGATAARAAAVREAQRQALEAERNALIAQLKAAGVKFAEKDIVQIVRSAAGKVVWLEKGNAKAGLQHIMERHASQFSKLGVNGEENVTKLVMDTLRTKSPIRVEKGGQVFSVTMGSTEREMMIVVGDNGFVVTAYPL